MFKALKRDRAFYGYLLRLTGPIALQNLITFSLGLIDTLMVSQLGNNEMAAVTAANVPVFLLISIVFGVQSGVGILISQYWGKKDLPSISRAIGVAAGLGVALALVIALALFLWPVQIMDLMSNKHHLSLLGAPYLRVIGFSYVFNMLSSIYVSAQRSVENASFGMKLFGMSTVLNTGMNYLLIFGKCGFPMLGVEGAAIATLLSRVAEFAVCLFCALRSRVIPLDLKALLRPGWEMLRRFVKYASPVMANELFWGLGNSLLTVILGHMTISVEFLAANAVMGNDTGGRRTGHHRPGACAAAVPAGDLPAVQAVRPQCPSCHHPCGDGLRLHPLPRLFHLRRHRYPAGRRRCVLVHGAGSGTPVAGGSAADGPAGAGAGRGSLVRVAGHTGGELYQVSHLPVAHPVP